MDCGAFSVLLGKKQTLLIVQWNLQFANSLNGGSFIAYPGFQLNLGSLISCKSPSHFNLCCCRKWPTIIFQAEGSNGIDKSSELFWLPRLPLVWERRACRLLVATFLTLQPVPAERRVGWQDPISFYDLYYNAVIVEMRLVIFSFH